MTQINRRTVTKGIAWSVPAVAIAGAAPAFAGSGKAPTGQLTGAFKYSGNSCGQANQNKMFGFELTVTNDTGKDIWLYSGGNYATVGSLQFVNNTPVGAGASVYLAAGAVQTFTFLMQNTNSGNESGQASIYIYWGHTETPGADDHDHAPMLVTGYINGFSPSKACCEAIGAPSDCQPDSGAMMAPPVEKAGTQESTADDVNANAEAEEPAAQTPTEGAVEEVDELHETELTMEEPAAETEPAEEATE